MKYNFNNTELKITAGLVTQLPSDKKVQIALSGRSNVGKSSLINTLIGRKSLARVSQSPGKTITINFYEVDKVFYLVDLPGYGYAKRRPEDKVKWSNLVDGYFTRYGDNVTAVAQLVDLKVGCTKDDLMMIDFMSRAGFPFFVIATKADKLNATEKKAALDKLYNEPLLKGRDIVVFSSLKGDGKEDVIDKIMSFVK